MSSWSVGIRRSFLGTGEQRRRRWGAGLPLLEVPAAGDPPPNIGAPEIVAVEQAAGDEHAVAAGRPEDVGDARRVGGRGPAVDVDRADIPHVDRRHHGIKTGESTPTVQAEEVLCRVETVTHDRSVEVFE